MLRKTLAIAIAVGGMAAFSLGGTSAAMAAPHWHPHFTPPHKVCNVVWRHHHKHIVCYWVGGSHHH